MEWPITYDTLYGRRLQALHTKTIHTYSVVSRTGSGSIRGDIPDPTRFWSNADRRRARSLNLSKSKLALPCRAAARPTFLEFYRWSKNVMLPRELPSFGNSFGVDLAYSHMPYFGTSPVMPFGVSLVRERKRWAHQAGMTAPLGAGCCIQRIPKGLRGSSRTRDDLSPTSHAAHHLNTQLQTCKACSSYASELTMTSVKIHTEPIFRTWPMQLMTSQASHNLGQLRSRITSTRVYLSKTIIINAVADAG